VPVLGDFQLHDVTNIVWRSLVLCRHVLVYALFVRALQRPKEKPLR
jgi:hypothetical protein